MPLSPLRSSSLPSTASLHNAPADGGLAAPGRPEPAATPLRRSLSSPHLTPLSARDREAGIRREAALAARFGSCQPARGKAKTGADGQVSYRSPIQKQELEPAQHGYRRVRINPTRVLIAEHQGPETSTFFIRHQADLEAVRRVDRPVDAAGMGAGPLQGLLRLDDLRAHRVQYKWDISANGSLVIGEVLVGAPEEVRERVAAGLRKKAEDASRAPAAMKEKKQKKEKKEKDAAGDAEPDPRQFMLGHVTLVGGALVAEPWQATRGLPQAHISGMLYARPDGTLCIDNDSGRFSEYEDRVPAHLQSVADMFARLGLPVAVDWKPKAPIPLARPAPRPPE
ncbi:XopV/AopV family type III secretion system effector [Paracidovorax avenae]|uniref:XopV/AopV family type III secretion system effector n=1 Tax=Paracidovorax avenae TaxID=80867 RepID=UPI0006B2F57A|nr:XopV/AopV family type III secretion system effector [Paracidovorax avenae]